MKPFAIAALLLLAAAAPAQAVDPSEMLKDSRLEARAEKIGSGLRCLVCQSESIEESNADLARDLRVVVRERVAAGDSDDQVTRFVVARYGDYVLLNPPFKAKTAVLWAGPPLLLLAGLWAALSFYRRRAQLSAPPASLSAEEKRRLDALLKETGER